MRVIFFKQEKELLERIRSGDEKAMERIYNKYRSEFLGWSRDKYNISEDDALDHYQDTLTIFFEKVINGSLTEIGSTLKTYLFGIGKNRIRRQFDVTSRTERHEHHVSEHFQFLAENEDDTRVFNEAREKIFEAFEHIGDQCKKILRLFYFEKKSMTAIAATMGHKSEAVSRTTKKRCLEKIREQLKVANADG